MININKEKDKLLKLLSESYRVLQDSDLQFSNLLCRAYKKINEGEDYKLICFKISRECNSYILKHISCVAKPIGELNNLVQEISKRYALKVGSVFNSSLYDILGDL